MSGFEEDDFNPGLTIRTPPRTPSSSAGAGAGSSDMVSSAIKSDKLAYFDTLPKWWLDESPSSAPTKKAKAAEEEKPAKSVRFNEKPEIIKFEVADDAKLVSMDERAKQKLFLKYLCKNLKLRSKKANLIRRVLMSRIYEIQSEEDVKKAAKGELPILYGRKLSADELLFNLHISLQTLATKKKKPSREVISDDIVTGLVKHLNSLKEDTSTHEDIEELQAKVVGYNAILEKYYATLPPLPAKVDDSADETPGEVAPAPSTSAPTAASATLFASTYPEEVDAGALFSNEKPTV